MMMLLTQMLGLVTALQLQKQGSEPIDTYIVVAKDDFAGYDNCETPGDCAAPCASPQTFEVRMCASHMCTMCGEPWCHESCRDLQAAYPTCKCPTWRDGKNTYSVSDIPDVDPNCLIGGTFSSAFENGNEGSIPEYWRRYSTYGSTGTRTEEQKHCGSTSAKFENDGSGWQLIENAARFTVENGVPMEATFWAYGAAGQKIRTEFLNYKDDSSSYQGGMATSAGKFSVTFKIAESDTWEKFTHSFTPGATKEVRMNIGIPDGKAYIDDVSIATVAPR
jgi:hypothetical protein